ncbi:MAG TPA: class F sortase [Candidatus Paceibacterota bacterium]|nr:class F sortase [Candidatus Paceibacterota bacterium]
MPKKKTTFISLTLGIIFIAFLVFIFIKIYRENSYPKISPSNSPSTIENSENYPINAFPVSLEIPSIGVNEEIIPLGLDKDGKMETPTKPMDLGWYNLGPAPGAIGSAVIAGHRGWKIGPAVFDNLHKVNVGDEVKVVDEKGVEYIFKVRETRIYNASEKITEVWHGKDGSYLNLITCSGKQNILTGSAESRLVVFTDLIS